MGNPISGATIDRSVTFNMARFEKGRSGNPGGRPKVLGELRDLARQHAPDAIRELARLAVRAKSEAARIAAIRELLDRGFGKAVQALEHAGGGGDPIDHEIRIVLVEPQERAQ